MREAEAGKARHSSREEEGRFAGAAFDNRSMVCVVRHVRSIDCCGVGLLRPSRGTSSISRTDRSERVGSGDQEGGTSDEGSARDGRLRARDASV